MEVSKDYDNQIEAGICPECGGQLIPTGGCNLCIDCGWSACG